MRNWVTTASVLTLVLTLAVSDQVPQAASAPDEQGGGGGRGGGGRGGREGGAPPAAPVDPRDLSGYWILPPSARDGRSVPTAALVPGVTRQRLAQVALSDWETVRYCRPIGLPEAMVLGTPYHIRITPQMMVILTEYAPAPNRYIYLNRQKHIPDDHFDRGVFGDSIAQWEGNVLVVDTTMIEGSRGILSIPGGGFRTADSRLVERFQMLSNGQVLQVVSTWHDAKVFKQPHSYEMRFTRMPRDYDGRLGSGCDPYDEARVAFLEKNRP